MPVKSSPRNVPFGSAAACGLALASVLGVGLLSGCASPPPPPPPPQAVPEPPPLPERPPALASIPAFDVGVRYAVDDLLVQMQRLPAFAPKAATPAPKAAGALQGSAGAAPARGVIVVDPAIDGVTGQQTAASRQLEKGLLQRAAESFGQFEVIPNDSGGWKRAEYVLAGTITPGDKAPAAETFRISLSLSDIRRGLVVAQSAVQVQAAGVDSTPTGFYRDSPSLTKDRVVEGQIRTAQTPAGDAADALYLERMPMTALINDAVSRYESGDYVEALRHYEEAARRPEGQQLRVFNGMYLANLQLNRVEAAEQSFAKIVAIGLATNSLSVKFLFRPGSTDFWPDPKVSGQYPGWLRAIAREAVSSKACLTLIGHTSRTGSEAFNDRLSLQRAASVQRLVEAQAPEAIGRLQSTGVGFRENLIGSGTDDLRDALDRRVEFKVRAC